MELIDRETNIPQFNHITSEVNASPLLTQSKYDGHMCDETSLNKHKTDCKKSLCKCQYILKVDKGDIVEIFFIDEGAYGLQLEHAPFDLTSAIHVHGYSFYVIAQERHGVLNEVADMTGYEKNIPKKLRKKFPIGNTIKMETIKILNEAGNITRNLKNPPLKDTVSVPDAGFSLIRFAANNPGFWMIHSTTTWFHYMGMEVVLQVGERNDIESDVPEGFPTCDNFSYE